MSREVMQQALEALQGSGYYDTTQQREAITALRRELEKPADEPVAWMVYTLDGRSVCVTDSPADFTKQHHVLPLYTRPQPAREWVDLTDDEVSKILDAEIGFNSCWGPETAFARAIEAKLKEKNHAS